MNRLYEFLRRHPTWVDGFWAFVLLFTSFTVIALPEQGAYEGPEWGGLLVAALLAGVVTLRRRWPEPTLLAAAGIGLLQVAGDVPPLPANFAFFVVIYTNASGSARRASRLALLMSLLAPTISSLRWPAEDADESMANAVLGAVFLTVAFCLAWVLGDSLRTRRAYYAELEQRAHRLEQERETQARMAVAAERARIARELHDVVAHNVSVMVVQADGAAYVLDTAPEQTRTALRTISGTGRQALTEMRRLLGVLRSEDTSATGHDYVPQPGVEQLADLVDQVRDTGLSVEFRIAGTPRPLPSGVELTAYRIVQEALTNSRKHGGPDVGATVTLEYGSDALTVLAEDDGRGAQRELYEERGADGLGQGLIGMRERVGMVGGVLLAGPRPGGGFRISATLPLTGGE
ncbi:sensor histidine kinase [Streptomyces radicis]|uniref:histidine kinase n=1 Tax=Streptomyces radicis TaxID=1750517 RepID=A0A3A9WCM5_9ACTN|nr:sensor histidine kinase [Streptomyces radicis]RKN10053.1 sensor histidine kinase [Streptomyces radicis]RKN24395.1 sensor histidine kinase [Streptomyces radicis]